MHGKCPVSVIIPTKNRFEDLLITLEAICKNKVLPMEVIIVDQTNENQEERLRESLRSKKCELNIKYFHEPTITWHVPACEFGASKSSGDWLLFLDDDITVSDDFFERLTVHTREGSDVDGVCAVDTSRKDCPFWKIVLQALFWRGEFTDERDIISKFHDKIDHLVRTRAFYGGFMACKRQVYLDTRFDERAYGISDVDFSYRASKKYKLFLDPRLKVVHRGGKIPSYDLEQKEFRRVTGKIFFFRHNVEKTLPNYLGFLWLMTGNLIGAVVRSVSNRSLKPLVGFVKGLRYA